MPRLQANSEAGWRAQEKQMGGSPEESQHWSFEVMEGGLLQAVVVGVSCRTAP